MLSYSQPMRLVVVKDVLNKGIEDMQIEEIASTLEERGIAWQAVGFALIGIVSVPLLWIYSEADHWTIGFYRIAVTQLNWAFAIAIAVTIERLRKMFETKTEIRRAARQKAINEAKDEGEREALARVRSEMLKRGIELSKEDEEALFNPNGHSR